MISHEANIGYKEVQFDELKTDSGLSIFIVIVLYRIQPSQSATLNSLKKVFAQMPEGLRCELLVYDNSPNPTVEKIEIEGVEVDYHHDHRNSGLCEAYNQAWKRARELSFHWLLLLDQDTKLSAEYFNEMTDSQALFETCVAVVPKLYSGKKQLSPMQVKCCFAKNHKLIDRNSVRICHNELMALNSSTLIKVSYLNQIGGFNPEFPLDYLDHWLYYQIYHDRQCVFLLRSHLEHDLSLLQFERKVSISRYENILRSEIRFYRNYRKPFTRFNQSLNLFARSLLFFKRHKKKKYAIKSFTGALILLLSLFRKAECFKNSHIK